MSVCTDASGSFLTAIIDACVPILKEIESESIKKAMDQVLYCLYTHPSKKSKAKHLVDHGATPRMLTWTK